MTGQQPPPTRTRTLRRTTIGLGTFIYIESEAPEDADPVALLDRVCAGFERIDALMHPTREGSDLAAIARALPGDSIQIQPPTFALLTLCKEVWRASGGLFDPCTPERAGRLDDVTLLAPDGVRIGERTVSIDLGGIAKGFAIDRALDTLREGGCTAALINAGGDVGVFGSAPHVIELRIGGRFVGDVALKNEALAVSEPRSDRSPSEHRGFYSPQTGTSVAGRAIAVRAPTASIADALTKCAMLASPGTLASLLQSYRAELIDRGTMRPSALAPRPSPVARCPSPADLRP